MMEKVSHLR